MSDYIPDHILDNVLLRLPISSLFRFKCVSKLWRDLIESSDFVERHSSFIRPCPHPDTKIITLVGTKFYAFDTVVQNGRSGYVAIARKLSSHEKMESDGLHMAGSCNGILCLSNYWTGDFALWDPFTGSSLYSDKLTSPPHEFTSNYRHAIQTAFGYDHLNDDYKLVQWYLNAARGFNARSMDLYQLFVYSFKQNSWRIITDAGRLDLAALGGFLPSECGFAFANGTMHWVVEKQSGRFSTNFILAFDFGTCKFRQIPCAPLPAGVNCIVMSLSSLNGCLCLGYIYNYPTRKVDIWVMKDYGVVSSWTKLTCIDLLEHDYPSLRRFKVVAYSEERRKLMLQPQWGNLIMYDFDTKSLRDVAVDGEIGRCTSYVCVGSSISPMLLQ